MVTLKTIGIVIFFTVLILDLIKPTNDNADYKKIAIYDEVIHLMLIIGINFWVVSVMLLNIGVDSNKGIVVVFIITFISIVISRLGILLVERKQILKELSRVNKRIQDLKKGE